MQVESATFYHFLAASFALATLEDLQNQMPLRLTVEDYLLGVADLTGEVMRCVTVTRVVAHVIGPDTFPITPDVRATCNFPFA